MKKHFIIYILIFTAFVANGQEIPQLTENETGSLTIVRNQIFDGESLWGYMNGGADIYLEYGFEVLRVEEFIVDNETIKLELFKMAGPVSAFGIYSIKTYKCSQSKVLLSSDCLNPYQYQLLYGDYYLQIINESGSEKAAKLMKEIAGKITSKIEMKELQLPAVYLTDSLKLPLSEIKMVKGYLGIQNKLIEMAGYFDDIENYQVYFAKNTEKGENVKYYEVISGDEAVMKKFSDNHNGSLFTIIMKEGQRIVLRK